MHIKHIEEFTYGGQTSVVQAQSIFRKLVQEFEGNKSDLIISNKIDGAPAIVFGWIDNQFIVSTKSFFNKTPKYYKSVHEIEMAVFREQLDPNVGHKLIRCMELLPNVYLDGLYMGDLLWYEPLEIHNELKICHPNTLVYGFDHNHNLKDAELGISVHSKVLPCAESGGWKVVPHFGFESYGGVFNLCPRVVVNPDLQVVEILNQKLVDIQNSLDKIKESHMRMLQLNDQFSKLMEIYNNHCIKNELDWDQTEFRQWLLTRFEKEKDKRKSEKGKLKVVDQWSSFFKISKFIDMQRILDLQHQFVGTKEILLSAIQSGLDYHTFYKKDGELIPTGGEGIVVTDNHIRTKIVDRTTFSRLNFGAGDKGWK